MAEKLEQAESQISGNGRLGRCVWMCVDVCGCMYVAVLQVLNSKQGWVHAHGDGTSYISVPKYLYYVLALGHSLARLSELTCRVQPTLHYIALLQNLLQVSPWSIWPRR